MKNALQFTISSICTLGTLFGLGLYLNPSIRFDFQIWVVVMATLIMFGTQPKLSKSDLFNPSDKYSMLGLSLMGIIVNNLSVIHYALNHHQEFDFSFSKIIGFGMIWGGLGFRIFAIKKLSKYFSNAVTIHNEHQLYDIGIYGEIRHPSYTGAIICIVGTIVWLESWSSLTISLGLLFVAYRHRIIQEERILGLYFGKKYEDYCLKTGTLLPKFKIQVFDFQIDIK
jgi:protein-S-isoprenylcysteine O-methyltransferase Ste14